MADGGANGGHVQNQSTMLEAAPEGGSSTNPDKGVAGLAAVTGFGALLSALACCVLPLALVSLGVGTSLSSQLAPLVPFHWPLSLVAMAAVAGGWFLYFRRKRRACGPDGACDLAPPARSTLALLSAATVLVLVSAFWSYIEPVLMRILGGA